ncbi:MULTISPECIES: hypothetical protein [Acidaminococcus]|nr:MULTISPECIES: hypothetical protein [Acidaminococcus]MDD6570176.1 hypothetical protein [Acidaminococcus sp.]MDO5597316.1 hypothetical protein [Acidaminococcus sp.]
MDAITSSLELLIIAYPLVFVVMALFAALTYGLTKLFPAKE